MKNAITTPSETEFVRQQGYTFQIRHLRGLSPSQFDEYLVVFFEKFWKNQCEQNELFNKSKWWNLRKTPVKSCSLVYFVTSSKAFLAFKGFFIRNWKITTVTAPLLLNCFSDTSSHFWYPRVFFRADFKNDIGIVFWVLFWIPILWFLESGIQFWIWKPRSSNYVVLMTFLKSTRKTTLDSKKWEKKTSMIFQTTNFKLMFETMLSIFLCFLDEWNEVTLKAWKYGLVLQYFTKRWEGIKVSFLCVWMAMAHTWRPTKCEEKKEVKVGLEPTSRKKLKFQYIAND